MDKVGYHMRSMTSQDVEAVSKIEEKVFSMPWSRDDFLDMIEADYAYYFVAVYQEHGEGPGIPIACCGVRNVAGEGQITNVVVDGKWRRKGVAKALLNYMIQETEKEGIEAYTLEVRVSNQAAIHLYEKLGFRGEGVRPGFYEKPKEDALIMWKR